MVADGPGDADALRRAYEQGVATVDAICAEFNVKPHLLYRRARAEGWRLRKAPLQPAAKPRRSGAAAKARRKAAGTRRPAATPAASNEPGTPEREALIRRLYRRFERHLADSDLRLGGAGEGGSESAAEREARTLSTLARTLEKLIELEQDAARRARPAAPEAMMEQDVDRLREELARRIRRAARGGEDGEGPGGAELA